MKNVYLASAVIATILFASAAQADIFQGNGGTGFGDVIGNGSIEVTASGNTISGTLTTGLGPGDLSNELVLYIDSVAGGATGTGSFTDTGDDLRRAISGFNGSDRSTVNFAPGFGADYAIAIDSGFGGLWLLDDDSNFTFVAGVNLSPTGTTTSPIYTFDFDFAEIGITSSDSFDFVATYLNGNDGFRSNEAIGASDAPSGAINVERNTLTFSGFETFNAVTIPEPTSAALLIGMCLYGTSRRRRS